MAAVSNSPIPNGRAHELMAMSSAAASPGLSEPLLAEGYMMRAIEVIIEDDSESIITDPNKNARIIAKVVMTAISGAVKIPYVPIALKIPDVGPAAVAFNILAFWGLEVHWGLKLIDEVAGPRSDAELMLLERNRQGCCARTGTTIGGALISLTSQGPAAIPPFVYDPKEYRVAAAAGTDLSGAIFPAYSSTKLLQKVVQLRSYNEFEKRLHDVRIKMQNLLAEGRVHFVAMGLDDKLLFLRECNSLRSIQIISQKVSDFIAKLLTRKASLIAPQTSCNRDCSSHWISQFVGGILLASMQTAQCWYTFVNVKQLSNENGVPSFFASITFLANAYSMTTTLLFATEQLLNHCSLKKTSMAAQLSPKLTFISKSILLIFDVLALGPTSKIWGDFDKQDAGGSDYFEVTMMASIFLLLYTATSALVDDCVAFALKHKGTDDEKAILRFYHKWLKIERIVAEAGLLDFALFFSDCGEDVQALLGPDRPDRKDIMTYIQSSKKAPTDPIALPSP